MKQSTHWGNFIHEAKSIKFWVSVVRDPASFSQTTFVATLEFDDTDMCTLGYKLAFWRG